MLSAASDGDSRLTDFALALFFFHFRWRLNMLQLDRWWLNISGRWYRCYRRKYFFWQGNQNRAKWCECVYVYSGLRQCYERITVNGTFLWVRQLFITGLSSTWWFNDDAPSIHFFYLVETFIRRNTLLMSRLEFSICLKCNLYRHWGSNPEPLGWSQTNTNYYPSPKSTQNPPSNDF